jgi:hypothetical protein
MDGCIDDEDGIKDLEVLRGRDGDGKDALMALRVGTVVPVPAFAAAVMGAGGMLVPGTGIIMIMSVMAGMEHLATDGDHALQAGRSVDAQETPQGDQEGDVSQGLHLLFLQSLETKRPVKQEIVINQA